MDEYTITTPNIIMISIINLNIKLICFQIISSFGVFSLPFYTWLFIVGTLTNAPKLGVSNLIGEINGYRNIF